MCDTSPPTPISSTREIPHFNSNAHGGRWPGKSRRLQAIKSQFSVKNTVLALAVVRQVVCCWFFFVLNFVFGRPAIVNNFPPINAFRPRASILRNARRAHLGARNSTGQKQALALHHHHLNPELRSWRRTQSLFHYISLLHQHSRRCELSFNMRLFTLMRCDLQFVSQDVWCIAGWLPSVGQRYHFHIYGSPAGTNSACTAFSKACDATL